MNRAVPMISFLVAVLPGMFVATRAEEPDAEANAKLSKALTLHAW